MNCRPIGERCCLGGCPPENSVSPTPTPTPAPNNTVNITMNFPSGDGIVCTFKKNDLWSPQVPWDGSYICKGSVTFNFHGLTFLEDRTLKLIINPSPDYAGFSDFEANANVPINEVTFKYSQVGGDYFQQDTPVCPATELRGKLQLFEAIPDLNRPFPKQYFDIDLPAACK